MSVRLKHHCIVSIVIKYLQLDMAIFLFLSSKFMFERLIDVNSKMCGGLPINT